MNFPWATLNLSDTRAINGTTTLPGGQNPDLMLEYRGLGFSSWHPGGCHFASADGSVHFISDEIAQSLLESLATRARGEMLGNAGY